MSFKQDALRLISFVIMFICSATSYATTLSGNITADNAFDAYYSIDDNVQGTYIGSGNDWQTTFSDSVELVKGQDYFIHIVGIDTGGDGAFLGEFSLTGNDHKFVNNQTNNVTNTTDWKVSTTGWGNYVNASVVNGNNGVSPWGTRPGISSDATWIWSSDAANDNQVYFSLAISQTTTPPPIDQCATEFANGANSFDERGQIEFQSNSSLINSSGVLDFPKIRDNSGGTSCDSQSCAISGSPNDNLNLENFQSSSSNVNLTVSAGTTETLVAGEYKDVKAEVNATLNLSSFKDTYLMDKLQIKSGATLNLAPGDYWIDSFIMENDSLLNVTAPGTVRIYANDVQLKQRTQINNVGSANQLLVISYRDFEVQADSQVHGFLYASNNFTLQVGADLVGSVIAKKVKLEENSSITFDEAALNKLDAGGACVATEQGVLLGHYQFEETSWSGTDSVLDSSVVGNHASPIGTATPLLPTLEPLSCQVLDVPSNSDAGVQDGIDTALDVDVDIGDAGTISFWYRSDQDWSTSAARQLFDASNDTIPSNKYFYLSLQSSTLNFGLEDSNDTDLVLSASGLSYAANEWVHIAVSWDLVNDLVSLHLNGSLVSYTTSAGLNGQLGDTNSLYIGDNRSNYITGQSSANSADGQFDDLRIYSFAQSQTQINNDIAAVNDCEAFNVAYTFYQLEESIWPSTNTIIDSSGFTNHGSPIGEAAPMFPTDEQKSCQVIDIPYSDNDTNNDALDTGIDLNDLGNTGSISFWYRSNTNWTSGGDRQLLDASNRNAANADSNKHFFMVLRNEGTLRFALEDENDKNLTATTNTSYNTLANVWVHVAVTWDLPAQSIQIILDGVSQNLTYDNDAGLVDEISDIDTLYIGDNRTSLIVLNGTKKSANGQFDDIRLYRFAQSVSQVVSDAASLRPCDRDTIAFYQFEEVSWPAANTISDSSVNGFDASPAGDVRPLFPSSDQKSCQVLDVPLNTSDVTIDAATTGIDVDTDIGSEGTISFWYRSNTSWSDSVPKQLFDASAFNVTTDDSKFFYLSLQSGSLNFGLEDSDDKDAILQISGLSYAANEWVHVTATWDFAGDQIAIYLNGTLAGANGGLGLNGEAGDFSTLFIGDSRSNYQALSMTTNSANGQFDDLHIYNYAQTETGAQFDIAALTPCADRAYAVYPFESNSWTGSGTVLDASGNNHHGSPVGGVAPILSSEQVSCTFVEIPSNTSINVFDAIDTGVDMNELDKKGTISFWYRSNNNWNSGAARQLFDASTTSSSNSNPNKHFYLALTTAGKLQFALEDREDDNFTVSTSSAYTFAAGEWVHIAVTWDISAKALQLVVNGVSQSLTGSLENSFGGSLGDVDTLYLGDTRTNYVVFDGTGNSADGQFDNLRIYNVAQNVSDIISDKDNVTICGALDHYRIEHDGQGFTCEAETITIKACGDETCTDANLYNLSTSLSLSPSGWTGGDTIIFTGSTTAELNYTTAETIVFALTSANPNNPLKCFIGATETCAMDFVSAGMEFFGATIADQTLPVQIAETNFANVNIRAVKDDQGVCKASLAGSQTIDFAYDCTDPDTCLTSLVPIALSDSSGFNTGTLEVFFDVDGIASLSQLNYADAGQLTLRASAVLPDGSPITAGEKSVLVIPQYLGLSSDLSNLATHTAGINFDVLLTAYGALDGVLPNYQPGDTQLKVTRLTPTDVSANEGQLRYDGTSALTSALAASAVFANVTEPTLSAGVYSYTLNYSEVGSILLDVQDVNYLGNVIDSSGDLGGTLELGRFIPAYFEITPNSPELNDMCGNFSFVGQDINFAVDPELTVAAKNALGTTTQNYGNELWFYSPEISEGVSLLDSSSYLSNGTITEVFSASAAVLTGQDDFLDGQGTVTISDTSFSYNKVDGANLAYAPQDPFPASIDFIFSSTFLTDDDGVCYQSAYPAGCEDYSITNIGTGSGSSNVRFGRIVLDNTFGPDSEALTVNIKSEYYIAGQWLLNTDDNCTNIGFTEASGQLVVVDKNGGNFADSVDSVVAAGMGGGLLTQGQSNDNNDLLFTAPNSAGVLLLSLDPAGAGVNNWPGFLNIDWDLDGDIDNDDFPSATVTFGQFRGNDRIIHWREVFN